MGIVVHTKLERPAFAVSVFALLALAAACGGAAPPCIEGGGAVCERRSMPHGEDEERSAASAMVTRFVDSWNRSDGAAYGENYWPDAELVDPTGALWNGKDAIAQMHVDLWSSIFKGSRIEGSVRKLRRLGPDFLLVDVDLALYGVKQPPPGAVPDAQGALHNHLKHILERRGGAWRIVSAQNTFIVVRPK
jgi:uncharacterized protein (TIGR02246 family)